MQEKRSKTGFKTLNCCFQRLSQETGNTACREAGRTQATEVQSRISPSDYYHYLQINEINPRYTESPLESTSVPGTKGTARVLEWRKKRGAVSTCLDISRGQ